MKSYALIVRLLKWALPASGIVLICAVIVGPLLEKQFEKILHFVDFKSPAFLENHLVHPRFVSRDEKGQPYEITARSAKSVVDNIVDLVEPLGHMSTHEGNDIEVKSKDGAYNQKTRKVFLKGQVVVTRKEEKGNPYTLLTESAAADLNKGDIEGSEFVTGTGPAGDLKGGSGFYVKNKGEVLVLKGVSQVVLKAKKTP